MIDMFGEVGVGMTCCGIVWGELGLEGERGVDTALERQIFITLRIGSNDEDSENDVKSLVTSHKAAILEK